MPIYSYKALKDTKRVFGEIETDNKTQAIDQLKKDQLVVLELTESSISFLKPLTFKKKIGTPKKIKQKDITALTRQLSSLLVSGLPIVKALGFLSEQATNPNLKRVTDTLKDKLKTGQTFSSALSEFPKYFDSLYISIIKSGEIGGILAQSVEKLANMRESNEDLRAKIKGALTYPVIMALVMIIAVAIMMIVVVPRFALMFQNMGQALPVPTMILMKISITLKDFWWLFILVFVSVFLGYKKYVNTPKGRLKIDFMKLKLPIVGPILHKVSMVRWCSTFGTLLSSGVPLLTSLQASSKIASNEAIAQAVKSSIKYIREGKKLGITFKSTQIFPQYVTEMIIMGEESGSLDKMLIRVSDHYDREVDNLVKNLTSLLEPIMILIMGVVVGFIVMAMLLPIFQMDIMTG